jgi:hypothetical protein
LTADLNQQEKEPANLKLDYPGQRTDRIKNGEKKVFEV